MIYIIFDEKTYHCIFYRSNPLFKDEACVSSPGQSSMRSGSDSDLVDFVKQMWLIGYLSLWSSFVEWTMRYLKQGPMFDFDHKRVFDRLIEEIESDVVLKCWLTHQTRPSLLRLRAPFLSHERTRLKLAKLLLFLFYWEMLFYNGVFHLEKTLLNTPFIFMSPHLSVNTNKI